MNPALAASDLTTGLFVVVWIGFLLSLGFAKIYHRAMKERELQELQDKARAQAETEAQAPADTRAPAESVSS